jgi:hypothetical protein
VVSVSDSAHKQVRLLLLGLCLSLEVASAVTWETPETETEAATSEKDQSDPASDRKQPPPVKPPREPGERGLRVALLIGINVFAWAGYAYETRISLPGEEQLQYRGTEGSPGATLFAGTAVTLPGALRRITLGAGINAGSLYAKQQRVIPTGAATPFSQENLQSDIRVKYANSPAWHSAFSPYIEHNLGSFHGSRVRAGYQYWEQSGSYIGSFAATSNSRASAGYNVGLTFRSHLARISVNDHIDLEDSDTDPNTPQRSKRQSGMIRQWGVLIGTHRTLIIFGAIGLFWDATR